MKQTLHAINPLNNAELLRHLWTQFSPLRLIMIPLLIAAITVTFGSFKHAAASFYMVSLLVALGSHMVLANLAAAGAMREEATDNSWDFQRMSSLTSGELSMGKLYGVTSLYSYCTALALIINITCVQFMDDLPHGVWLFMTFIAPLGLILCGFLGQSLSFLLSLNTFSGKRKYAAGGHSFCGVLAGGILLYYFTSITLMGTGLGFIDKIATNPSLSWHGIQVGTTWFMMASLALFLLWTHIGIYRLMRTEMQYQNRPWVWIGILAAMLLYLTGLPEAIASANPNTPYTPLTIPQKFLFAAYAMLPISYIGGYVWAGYQPSYTRFFLAIKRRDWQTLSISIPPWFINISIYLLLLVSVAVASWASGHPQPQHYALAIGLFLLALRDIAVFHAILMPGATRHAGFLILLYMLCMYVLGPKISGPGNTVYFLPNGDYAAIPLMFMEVAIAGILLYAALKKARRGIKS